MLRRRDTGLSLKKCLPSSKQYNHHIQAWQNNTRELFHCRAFTECTNLKQFTQLLYYSLYDDDDDDYDGDDTAKYLSSSFPSFSPTLFSLPFLFILKKKLCELKREAGKGGGEARRKYLLNSQTSPFPRHPVRFLRSQ